MWEPKTNVNWVTLSPNYGSYNTITTETDTVKVTVSTANMTVGTNSRPYLHLGHRIERPAHHCSSHRHCDLIGDHGIVTPTSSTAAPSRFATVFAPRPITDWECDSTSTSVTPCTNHRSGECDMGCEQRSRPGRL